MDFIGTPEEYLNGTDPLALVTPEGDRILSEGLGPDWLANYTFVGPTIDADKAREIVVWELAHAGDVL